MLSPLRTYACAALRFATPAAPYTVHLVPRVYLRFCRLLCLAITTLLLRGLLRLP